jgi:hypothetical protein
MTQGWPRRWLSGPTPRFFLGGRPVPGNCRLYKLFPSFFPFEPGEVEARRGRGRKVGKGRAGPPMVSLALAARAVRLAVSRRQHTFDSRAPTGALPMPTGGNRLRPCCCRRSILSSARRGLDLGARGPASEQVRELRDCWGEPQDALLAACEHPVYGGQLHALGARVLRTSPRRVYVPPGKAVPCWRIVWAISYPFHTASDAG